MIDGREVVIDVEGQQVRGWITVLERHKIIVALVEPLGGPLAESGHVPYFARGHLNFALDGQITLQGREWVEEGLARLFRMRHAVERDREVVALELARAQEAVRREHPALNALTQAEARAERSRLRAQFRRGGLELRVYEQELRVVRLRAVAYSPPSSEVFARLGRALEARWGRVALHELAIVLRFAGFVLWPDDFESPS